MMSPVSPALCYVRLWVGDALDIIDQIWPQNHIWYIQLWVGNAGDIIDLIWPYSHTCLVNDIVQIYSFGYKVNDVTSMPALLLRVTIGQLSQEQEVKGNLPIMTLWGEFLSFPVSYFLSFPVVSLGQKSENNLPPQHTQKNTYQVLRFTQLCHTAQLSLVEQEIRFFFSVRLTGLVPPPPCDWTFFQTRNPFKIKFILFTIQILEDGYILSIPFYAIFFLFYSFILFSIQIHSIRNLNFGRWSNLFYSSLLFFLFSSFLLFYFQFYSFPFLFEI
ncbi:hypothetical protein AB205_0023670 [Aquarana catesbeiana]|uniref:Uncharacterized protein n=1 Tax=Aquarana catesbeiana TaxID=8400 RepID=A0A2G9SCQ8_AQUCT|nr:hypothetical protein AB205_0023670 [Aquarana catesbeiana]